ncbi:hypothetical protein RRG08_050354 [Elysia crispata]|uniref:Uncharacterized protein n=1 Tax=Elysia crispata TaxID=231223 RepID=A0AAE0XUD6_9GAST|nr:hypothetical protein RRG08_050354 [Elysia crispata]
MAFLRVSEKENKENASQDFVATYLTGGSPDERTHAKNLSIFITVYAHLKKDTKILIICANFVDFSGSYHATAELHWAQSLVSEACRVRSIR